MVEVICVGLEDADYSCSKFEMCQQSCSVRGVSTIGAMLHAMSGMRAIEGLIFKNATRPELD